MKKIIFSIGLLLIVFLTPSSVALAAQVKSATSTADLLKQKVAVAKIKGTITALNATSITVSNITVNISANTNLLHKYGAKAKLSEFSVGDEVQVLGKWTNEQKSSIDARILRNMSLQKRRGVFLGQVTSVSNTGFVLTPEKRPAQTVGVNLLTKYVDRTEKPIALKDIKIGDKVMVKGLWDTKLNTVTEVVFVRDYSIK